MIKAALLGTVGTRGDSAAMINKKINNSTHQLNKCDNLMIVLKVAVVVVVVVEEVVIVDMVTAGMVVLLFVLINLAVELTYGVLDPRVRAR